MLLTDDVVGPTRTSIENESKLSNLGKAADHFFDRCEDTARNTDHSIRCWSRSHVQGRPYKATRAMRHPQTLQMALEKHDILCPTSSAPGR